MSTMQLDASVCAICGAKEAISHYEVMPTRPNNNIVACATCISQIESLQLDENHWKCLHESVWSEIPAVQVVSWRILQSLQELAWARDVLDMMYLDEDLLAWAKAGLSFQDAPGDELVHKDCNGAVLASGDTVTLIKDLDVKGANFTAKRGTAVRNISLVADNAEQIEGKVNGQQIVILTKFVKKS